MVKIFIFVKGMKNSEKIPEKENFIYNSSVWVLKKVHPSVFRFIGAEECISKPA